MQHYILMYGAETWTISMTTNDHLCALKIRCYRRVLTIKWTDWITNKVVLKIKIKERLLCTIKRITFIYYGHTIRKGDLQIKLLGGKVEGRRGRRRPQTMWTDNIRRWTGLTHIAEARREQDRHDLRAVVSNPLN